MLSKSALIVFAIINALYWCILMIIFVYGFVNVRMVNVILSIVGLPLPFIRYGSTVIITLMATFGIVISIHTHR